MEMKYEFTGKSMEFNGHTLFEIRALKSFRFIKAGDKGGFIESEDNLSQAGTCWVTAGSKVYGKAKVKDDAIVNKSIITDKVVISEHAIVNGSYIHDKAKIRGSVNVKNGCNIYKNTVLGDDRAVPSNSIIALSNSKREDPYNPDIVCIGYLKGELNSEY